MKTTMKLAALCCALGIMGAMSAGDLAGEAAPQAVNMVGQNGGGTFKGPGGMQPVHKIMSPDAQKWITELVKADKLIFDSIELFLGATEESFGKAKALCAQAKVAYEAIKNALPLNADAAVIAAIDFRIKAADDGAKSTLEVAKQNIKSAVESATTDALGSFLE